MNFKRLLAVRWTMGDVNRFGFEALRLSVWGAFRLFGPAAHYTICINSLPVETARQITGELPEGVHWFDATGHIPEFLAARFDRFLAEGVGWKFAPLRLFPERYELALDNDCILWEIPAAIQTWLEGADPARCVFAEDVKRCLGQFGDRCGPEPRNSGIRGLPPNFDLAGELRLLLADCAELLSSETDEQGLQTAVVCRAGPPLVVTVDEVSICSPFPPHLPHLGTCGAHFVGLNAHRLPWEYEGRPAVEFVREHWQRHRRALYDKVELDFPRRKEPPPGRI
jgi:hypothetical protein